MLYYLNLSLLSNNLNNQQKKAENRKLLSAEARRILSVCEGRSITDGDMARDAAGRPFFPAGDVQRRDTDFSISHSGSLAAVSLVRGKNLRTGCDVELVRPRAGARKIAKELFTAPEREYIESGGKFDVTRFYRIWTLKECFLKLRGLSVFDMPGAPSFISGNAPEVQFKLDAAGASPLSFNLYELTGGAGEHYILASAVEIEGPETPPPEIRWFSEESLTII